jgi:hypothetical protein
MRSPLIRCLLILTATGAWAADIDVDGFIDLRLVHGDTDGSWTEGGLGKQRYDATHEGLRLGQGMLTLSGNLADTLRGQVTLSAQDDRHGIVDVNEAFLR